MTCGRRRPVPCFPPEWIDLKWLSRRALRGREEFDLIKSVYDQKLFLETAVSKCGEEDSEGSAGAEKTGENKFHEIKPVTPCFTPGTLIATPMGERRVEDLKAGDRVITRDNGIQAIRWAGRRTLDNTNLTRSAHLQPVLIREGALGDGLPERDMMVSPNHRVLVANDKTALYFEEREVLAAAKHLTGLPGVDAVQTTAVTYLHFMCDQHEVVLSDGAWTESFQPGDQTLRGMDNSQRSEIFEVFPELASIEGQETYAAARRSLKRHETQLLVH